MTGPRGPAPVQCRGARDDRRRPRPADAAGRQGAGRRHANPGTMERDLARIDGLKGEIDGQYRAGQGQISEARLKIIELDQQVRTEAQRELRRRRGARSPNSANASWPPRTACRACDLAPRSPASSTISDPHRQRRHRARPRPSWASCRRRGTRRRSAPAPTDIDQITSRPARQAALLRLQPAHHAPDRRRRRRRRRRGHRSIRPPARPITSAPSPSPMPTRRPRRKHPRPRHARRGLLHNRRTLRPILPRQTLQRPDDAILPRGIGRPDFEILSAATMG